MEHGLVPRELQEEAVKSAMRSPRGRPYFVVSAIDERGRKIGSPVVVEGTSTDGGWVISIPHHLLRRRDAREILAMPLQQSFGGSVSIGRIIRESLGDNLLRRALDVEDQKGK